MRSTVLWLTLLGGFACLAVKASEFPQRVAGLWEITLAESDARRARPVIVQECITPEFDTRMLLSHALGQDNCVAPEVSKTETGWALRIICEVHGNLVESITTLSGNFQTHYSGSYLVNYSANCGQGRNRCREEKDISARWLGECPVDIPPGYRKLPIGIVVQMVRGEKQPEDHADHRH